MFCILFIVLNVKMICGLRNIINKKIEMNCNLENSSSVGKENMCVIIMIVCMVVIIFLVEFLVGII